MRKTKTYGAVRVSTPSQCPERQIRNIKAKFSDAIISVDVCTGTTLQRKEFEKLLKIVLPGDTIVFDSVSRMSRNAEEGFELYVKLFEAGINLVFLKEPHINTDTYKKAINVQIQMTGTNADIILQAIKEYLMTLAKEQIRLAFEQSEKEVKDLQQRTREGIETARLAGKQIGQKQGVKLTTKKSLEMKGRIRKMSREFEGNMPDKEVMEILRLARNTYYKYKREMLSEEQFCIEN